MGEATVGESSTDPPAQPQPQPQPRPSKSSASSSAASTPESKDGKSDQEEDEDEDDEDDRGAGASGVSSLSSQLWGPERTVEVRVCPPTLRLFLSLGARIIQSVR